MFFCDFCGNTFEKTFENNYRHMYNCVPATSAVIQLNLRKRVFSATFAKDQPLMKFILWFSQKLDFRDV